MRRTRLGTRFAFRLCGGGSDEIEHAAAIGAGPAPRDAAHQLAGIDVHQHNRIKRLADVTQHPLKRTRLRKIAREPVQDEAALRVRLGQTLPDHPEDDPVFDEQPAIHRLLGLESKRGSLGDGRAQQIACGDLRNPVPLDETL